MAVSFLSRFRGSFTSTLRWHQLDQWWTSLRSDVATRQPKRLRLAALLLVVSSMGAGGSAAASTCEAPVAVQVLGSGGPEAQQARASAGYLLWLEGKAPLLVDRARPRFTPASARTRYAKPSSNTARASSARPDWHRART
jgi:hypothetical protein